MTCCEEDTMILLGLFAALTVFSITQAEGKWKIWNVLIILASSGVGFLVAYLAGTWARNMGLGGEIAVPTSLAFGSLAAVFCPRRKKLPKPESVPGK
jgi:hypothetical protein